MIGSRRQCICLIIGSPESEAWFNICPINQPNELHVLLLLIRTRLSRYGGFGKSSCLAATFLFLFSKADLLKTCKFDSLYYVQIQSKLTNHLRLTFLQILECFLIIMQFECRLGSTSTRGTKPCWQLAMGPPSDWCPLFKLLLTKFSSAKIIKTFNPRIHRNP